MLKRENLQEMLTIIVLTNVVISPTQRTVATRKIIIVRLINARNTRSKKTQVKYS